jgi:hypothetical protein
MSELDEPRKGTEPKADAQPSEEGSPVWIVAVMVLLLVALIVWFRLKK